MSRKKLKLQNNPLLSGPSLAGRNKFGSPYREILLSEIDVDPNQPRRVFETEGLSELAASIKEYGVLCPLLVRALDGGSFRLIAGERRFRAAKLAGLKSVPVIVDSADDDEAILPKQLVENLQRKDLTPLERAQAFGELSESLGLSVRDLAKKLGVSKSLVQRSLDVLSLPDDLKKALLDGYPESKVLLLATVKDKDKRKQLLKGIDSMSRSELEVEVGGKKKAKVGKLSHRGTISTGETYRLSPADERLQQEFQRALGTKVVLQRKPGDIHGKIVIEFYSEDDLSELFRRLVFMGDDNQAPLN
ncbi:ParB/RepB/Spo0J family partition protein [bacterium]|nr:ParB/RepB/Spo0J family partition protein [bacterium]